MTRTEASQKAWIGRALELCSIPTAAGHEDGVEQWIRAWTAERDDLILSADEHGNIDIRLRGTPAAGLSERPIYFTAHMDHPAFVIEEKLDDTRAKVSFRGGVMKDYFPDAPITLHTSAGPISGTIRVNAEGDGDNAGPWKLYEAAFEASIAPAKVGDIAIWTFPPAELVMEPEGGMLHTPACDDLAALSAALCAMDELRELHAKGEPVADVRLLLTRAEEIGFIGAIGACRSKTMPMDSRVIALENSRASADAPIGGGPIVRVGDRISVFTPELTSAVAKVAEEIAGGPAQPLSTQKRSDAPAWRWQRKLMSGGACEASVFCGSGYEATCVCLPLGNYHNMASLDAVQAGTFEGVPRAAREFVAASDYFGMIDLLVGCGRMLGDRPSFMERVEKLWDERAFVLDR